MEIIHDEVKKLGYLFYIASPNETSFRTAEQVPELLPKAAHHFLALVILEAVIIQLHKNGEGARINDMITSSSHAIMYLMVGAFSRGMQLTGYEWMYERRLIDLDWDSPVTWLVAAIGVDFGFYWLHRFVHETSIGWAAHQVHHSSEDYNLTTALRQPLFQNFLAFGFYLPCALLGVPLSAAIVHLQFNKMYQFWTHTELISTIGPLEYVLNTASHHRVHHGSDPWCLDKNYAAVLIIWDRIFGTFQEERKDVKITYGLVKPPKKLNIAWNQVYYYKYIFQRAAAMKTWKDSFKALFYHPSWTPETDINIKHTSSSQKVKKVREKYNPKLSRGMEAYVVAHFFVSLMLQNTVVLHFNEYTWLSGILNTMYLLLTLSNIGALYDGWSSALLVEAIRCTLFTGYLLFYSPFTNYWINVAIICYNAFSALLWLGHALVPDEHHKLN